MDILFILLGVAIFFAAAAVFAIDHFEIHPAQAAVSFALPPFAWWLYYHHWRRARIIALTQFIAFLLVLGGFGMKLLFPAKQIEFSSTVTNTAIQQSGRMPYVGSDQSLRDLAQAERKSRGLNGRLKGQAIQFMSDKDVAEFDFQGTLRIKLGKNFFGDFELAIELGQIPEMSVKSWSKTIRADSRDAPAIYLSWLDKQEGTIKSLKFESGYIMDLKLTHEEYNFFSGYMQLILPDPDYSFLVGNFPVYSSRLRFHGEGIIRDHDSVETLEVIANQSLKTTYRKEVDTVYGFQETSIDFRTGDGIGRSNVILKNREGLLKRVPLVFYKNEQGWYLDVKGLRDVIKSKDDLIATLPNNLSKALEVDFRNIGDIHLAEIEREVEPVSVSEVAVQERAARVNEVTEPVAKAQPPDTEAADILRIDIATQEEQIPELLKSIMNVEVELQSIDGKFKNGVYVGVHRKQVVLETGVGGGLVEFLTEYRKVKSIRVLNAPNRRPQKIEFYSSAP